MRLKLTGALVLKEPFCRALTGAGFRPTPVTAIPEARNPWIVGNPVPA